MRLAEVQTCPLLRNRAHAAPGTATSRSASSKTISGSMPPSSRLTRFNCSAARTAMRVPTAVDPVNAMHATFGSSMRAAPTSSPVPVTTLTTPGGKWARAVSTSRNVASGVNSEGLMTTAVPRGERRRNLPDQQQQRVVERDDGRHDPERLLDREVDLVLGRRRDGGAIRAAGELGVVLKARRAPLHFVEVLDARLAAFAGEQLRKSRPIAAHQSRGFVQHLAAFERRQASSSAAAPWPPRAHARRTSPAVASTTSSTSSSVAGFSMRRWRPPCESLQPPSIHRVRMLAVYRR